MQRITPCLWFDGNAEQAARFYVSIFKNSKIKTMTHYTKVGPMPEGTVLTVIFTLEGQEFMALNGTPAVPHTMAVSFMANVKTQKELDRLWKKLTAGGKEVQCGWLTDKFGVTWQVVPTFIGEMLKSKDAQKRDRVMRAIMGMVKLDIAALKRAYAGK
jgi:predicted 3-demethylubiquinone-9 3-methyltransferase (glyoxalase superfamily)